MDSSKKREWEKASEGLVSLLDKGILLSSLMEFNAQYHFRLTMNLSGQFGFLLFLSIDRDYWGSLGFNLPIHPGPSAKGAMAGFIFLEEALEFVKENADRIVVKGFSRNDGEGFCLRYYLKKIKRSISAG